VHGLHRRSSVLLTGATGLIGGELLRVLLDTRYPNLTALVRAGNGTDPGGRVADRLKRSGCDWSEQDEGVQAVAGDLRFPGLGLDSVKAERLKSETEIIIH